MHGMSQQGCKEEGKKERSCTSQVGRIKNATSAKLLEIMHKSYGFNSDQIEAFNYRISMW